MKKGHDYNINDPRYVKTLGPVVSIATDNALAPAEQVVDDDFLYNTTVRYLNTELTDDDKSQWLINRILRDHLRNVENGNFSGDVTIEGDLTVNGDYVNLPVATTTKAGIVRLSANSNDVNSDSTNGTPVPSTALVKSMLEQLKNLLLGGDVTPDLDTILELADIVQSLQTTSQDHEGRIDTLEDCCDEVQGTIQNHTSRIENLEECCEDLHYGYTVTIANGLNTTNNDQTVVAGSWYYSHITNGLLQPYVTGYVNGDCPPITNFSVKMGGVDITDRCITLDENNTGYHVSIPNVSGNIVISGISKSYWYVVARVVPSESVEFGQNGVRDYWYDGTQYYKKIKINDPYTDEDLYNYTINNTKFAINTVVENGVKYLEISSKSSLDGNYAPIITISEKAPTPAPATLYTITKDYDPSQVSLSDGNAGSSIAEGSPYTVKVSPKSGYQIDSVAVTHNGQPVTVTITGTQRKAVINSVQGNITIDVDSSAIPQETIPSELANVEKIYLNDHATRIFKGEWDINSMPIDSNASAPLPRSGTFPSDSSAIGGANLTNRKYYYNWNGGYADSAQEWSIIVKMNNTATVQNRTNAVDYILSVISNYNDSVSDELKVAYYVHPQGQDATDYVAILLSPYKFNAGKKRIIEVVLTNIPNSLIDTTGGAYWGGQHYTKTTSTQWPVAFVVQDKSTAVYEVVDENNNVIATTLGQDMGLESSDPNWALFGNYRYLQFGNTGSYAVKVRAFGITNVVRSQDVQGTYFDTAGSVMGLTHKYALDTNWTVVNGASSVVQPSVVNVNTSDNQTIYGWDETNHRVRNLAGSKPFKSGTASEIGVTLPVQSNSSSCKIKKADNTTQGISPTAYNNIVTIEYGIDTYNSTAPIKENTTIWPYIDDEDEENP